MPRVKKTKRKTPEKSGKTESSKSPRKVAKIEDKVSSDIGLHSDREKTVPTERLPEYESWETELGDWKYVLSEYLETGDLRRIHTALEKEYAEEEIFPPPSLIFNSLKLTPFSEVKVVILGQDPYINPGEAMGLAFSIPKGVKVPPSLKNIYIALQNDKNVDFTFPDPIHGDLTKWASQGVLLLNAVLTVRRGKSNSHKSLGWDNDLSLFYIF